MSLTPSNVTWDPNRYKATEYVISYDSNGVPTLSKKEADYTGTSYNFAELPTDSTTTTTTDATTTGGTTDQTTTQEQTTEAFGDVKPHYWQDEGGGGGGGNVFQWNEKSAQTEEDTTAKEYRDYANDAHLQAQFPTFEAYQKSLHPFKSRIESITDPFKKPIKKAWEWAKPLAIKAMEYATKRPTILGKSADQSFRGVAGLYNSEINLMTTYGSVGPTDGNPTGDPRKDDAGFNIVSGAGNYNKLGTNSRRHNMLKVADNLHEKGSKEWRDARDKIRNDFKIEKETGIINNDYNIDSSGSKPSAPTDTVKPGNGGQTQAITSKPTHQFHPSQGGQNQGGSNQGSNTGSGGHKSPGGSGYGPHSR